MVPQVTVGDMMLMAPSFGQDKLAIRKNILGSWDHILITCQFWLLEFFIIHRSSTQSAAQCACY